MTPFLLGYFLGSLPVAYWFGALRGKDLLKEGSGNPGALNAFRLLGPVPGLLVLLLDLFKGALAVAVGEGVSGSPLGGLLGGVGAVWGHAFSPWLLFRGGKALAPGAGVLLAVDPRLLLWALALFALLTALFRRPYRAVFAVALAMPLLAAMLGKTAAHLLFGLGVGLPVAFRHLKDWNR
ncbi:glycerol-3-phosphate acyltransferase [Thermus aquaticus]|uniref:Glycerol-3-phosphate acyltransferase n=2 Tax=Thermus aquaticus TaxID=271 RepID=A0A0N0BME4_THEAQ|nr:glycerol-3-phosphate acyltransferase [Thermus aquaticus]ALJ90579.1 acyl-phosphate:glycerol-3-phosphate O-acyltransferase PlsY [Thermus aquaticus Y51MC23]KOX90900.1 Glycerol-3-phosphate acyltransferase [Thermus aquaticus]